uniref:Uncharacterized protein n=1 Tax=Globisporangium ultimum (strain ATCC 200006 / CBS 805.95 / DAOM BR144) TaxID=431595 RepID=K3W802_GLOUD
MATATKRKRGRPPRPPCAPTEPYSAWPAAQLLAECARRGISVRRKGARANNSKAGLTELLEQFDANNQSRVREQQRPSPRAATTRSYEYEGSSDEEDNRPLFEQQSTRDAAMTALLDGAMDEAAEAEIDEEDVMVLPQSPYNKKTRRDDVDSHDYNSTFRLVNVLFTSYVAHFAALCDFKSIGEEDMATRSMWSNVAAAYHSQNPLYARIICQNHAVFRGINPLLHQRSRWQSLARIWHQMCRIYGSAMGQLRQTKADEMTQFYSFCDGRLDVLYLHLWLLLRPQFASHFVLQEQSALRRCSSRNEDTVEPMPASIASTSQTEHDASRSEDDVPTSPRRQTVHAQNMLPDLCLEYNHSPVLVSEEPIELQADAEPSSTSQSMDAVTRTEDEAPQPKKPRRQKPHLPDPCPYCNHSSIHGREDSHTTQAESEAFLTLQTQALRLELQVLCEKRQLALGHTKVEQQCIRDERRRRLLQDVREVATTIAELQTRLEQQQLRVAHGTGDAAQVYLADLERDMAFFTRQKRRLMADLLEHNSSDDRNRDDGPLR